MYFYDLLAWMLEYYRNDRKSNDTGINGCKHKNIYIFIFWCLNVAENNRL